MRFVIEKSEIDFGTTNIDNIFIEDYMPVANGSFVKVYLYAYKNMISNPTDFNLTNEVLAKNLQLTLKDVEDAWNYWENEGVVEKIIQVDDTYDIKFINLKKYYMENKAGFVQSKIKPKEETLMDLMTTNERVREMFGNVDYFMRRQTTPTEKLEIISWISDFNMSPEMIEIAFEFCTEKKKKVSVNYVRAVILSWYDKKLSSVEEVEEELRKTDEKYIRKNSVLRKLGLQYRVVSEPEINLINSWYDLYKIPEDLIDEAISRTSKISRPSINYVNSILIKWRDLGINSLDDIEKKDVKPKKASGSTKTKFHNFSGQSAELSEEELNEIARNLTNRRSKKR